MQLEYGDCNTSEGKTEVGKETGTKCMALASHSKEIKLKVNKKQLKSFS